MEKYTLIKRIGSGSYGTAYLGKEKRQVYCSVADLNNLVGSVCIQGD